MKRCYSGLALSLVLLTTLLATTAITHAQDSACHATYAEDNLTLHVPCVKLDNIGAVFDGVEFLFDVTLNHDTQASEQYEFVAYALQLRSNPPDDEACYAHYDFQLRTFYVPCLNYKGAQLKVKFVEIDNGYAAATSEIFNPNGVVFSKAVRFIPSYVVEVEANSLKANGAKPTYPVLFVHGLKSHGGTWDYYIQHWVTAPQNMRYGGNIKITDVFHVSEPGAAANANVRRNTPFSFMYEVNLNELVSADFYTMNFANHADISYAAQGLQVKEAVHAIINLTGAQGVFLVGHSMGGLASRAYLQYFEQGDNLVKGVITVGTPHLGRRNDLLGNIGGGAADLFVGGVVPELTPNSTDLNLLNNLSRYPLPANVPVLAVTVRGKTPPSWFSNGSTWDDSTGDGVVSIPSQAFSGSNWPTQEVVLGASSNWFSNKGYEVHTQETSSPEIGDAVWSQLLGW